MALRSLVRSFHITRGSLLSTHEFAITQHFSGYIKQTLPDTNFGTSAIVPNILSMFRLKIV